MDVKNNTGGGISSINKEMTAADGIMSKTASLISITLAYVFAMKTTYFGAHPLGIALIAVLPGRVWASFAGAVFGYVSLGCTGIIYALSSLAVVLLRFAVAPSGKRDGRVFSEGFLLRASIAMIGGFIPSVYEAIKNGFSLYSLLGVVIMVIATPLTVLGLYPCLGGKKPELAKIAAHLKSGKIHSLSDVFIILSSLLFAFLTSYSLFDLRLFGIDLWLVFSVSLTLAAAKKLGAGSVMAVGFVCGISVSLVYAVGLALMGCAVSILSFLRIGHAEILGGLAVVLFVTYSDGLNGLLSTLPEYLLSVAVTLPIIKKLNLPPAIPKEDKVEKGEDALLLCEEMADDAILRYSQAGNLYYSALEGGLSEVAKLYKTYEGFGVARLSLSVVNSFMRRAKELNQSLFTEDAEMTKTLAALPKSVGLCKSVIKVLGDRRKFVVIAAEDRSGRIFMGDEIPSKLEELTGIRFKKGDYLRNKETSLMTYKACEKYCIQFEYKSLAGGAFEVSGDSVCIFDTDDMYSYAIICDGMGSGERANRTSRFSTKFLKALFSASADENGIFHGLNGALRAGEECSVAIDIFRFDKITGEGMFIKSGAAASYIKRDRSLFRIRSSTMPIGVLKTIDAEKIQSRIGEGDMIFILSDGIAGQSEDAVNLAKYDGSWEGGIDSPWLIDALSSASDISSEVPERIIKGAVKNNTHPDDMTVIVGRVSKINS